MLANITGEHEGIFLRRSQQEPLLASGLEHLSELLGATPHRAEVLSRFEQYACDLWDGLAEIYDVAAMWFTVVELIAQGINNRPQILVIRDNECLNNPDWFQLPEALGYVAYTDRFAGTLQGVSSHIDYLRELGVTYLHLMPLLRPRTGENDGGYAVADFRTVREDLGTIDDLAALADSLHQSHIALTLDLVLNHVADQHEWAIKAQSGQQKYRDYFHMFPDRNIPDTYEENLPEVFPDFAPGNFTWDEPSQSWIWTTFNSWQWDLNWANPDVFCEFVDILAFLGNKGVDCFRLDALAFLWKRMGTSCQNQPEVHFITQALRAAMRIIAPAVIFQAEAIVAPTDLVAYLGVGEHAGKVSDLAYHNSLMVQVWSALASGDSRLLATALNASEAIPPTTSWATYLRCHDDIGWAIDDLDAKAAGLDAFEYRKYLSSYYAGELEGSQARGAHFQTDLSTGERRTSGSAASLAGIQAAVESSDTQLLSIAIDRLMCGYSMIFGYGGLPLIYMGDEIGLMNDASYLQIPEHAADNRWLHRPMMPWSMVNQRHDSSTLAGQVFTRMLALIHARKHLPALHAGTPCIVVATSNPAVVVFHHTHVDGDLIELYNVSDVAQTLPTSSTGPLAGHHVTEVLSNSVISLATPTITLEPYSVWWLTAQLT